MDLGRVSGFYPGGRPSGLPDDIVQRLVNAKKTEELDPLQNDLESAKQNKDVYSKLDDQFVSMVQSAESLNDSQAFEAYSASSSNSEVVTANAVSGASEGSYSVQVDQLAQAHNQLIGVDDGDDTTGVEKGISDPNDSSKINAGMEISFDHQGSQYTYSTDSETTLSSLADKIAGDSNGISASVSNLGTSDNPQYVMSLKSEVTGAGDNRITNGSGSPGINTTDTLFSVGATEQEETQAGLNASLFVDGVEYTRTNNTVGDVIDDVTLSLEGTGSDVDVTVSQDVESVTKKVQSFVDTFNNTNKFIDQLSGYNKEEDKAGPLMGSSVARSADSRMSRIMYEPISGTSDNQYQYLSQVGFEMQRDGSVDFDSSTFQAAMKENPQAVEKLFVGEDGAAGKMENALKEGFTDSVNGSVTNKIDTIDNRIDRINDQIEQTEQDLQNYRERQVQKFSNMEEAIMKYQSIENQLSNWMDLGKDDKA